MSRGKGTLFALVAIGAMMASPVVAATTSGAVAATDERAPEAVTDVTGFAGTDGVEITWALSASDFVRPSPTGSDFTSGGSFSNVNDVAGYNVYRDDELAGSVKAGETAFVDSNAIGSSIIYVVTAVDAAGNESDHSEEVIVSLGPAPVAVIGTPDGDYGIIDPDDFDTQTIDVENAATEDDANLTVTITVVGDGFSSSDDSIDLAPGEEGFVEITFDAEDVDNLNGIYVGTVTVKTTDPDNRKVVYDVTAEIVDGIGPTEIDVTPASVTFAATVIGNTRTTELTIANIGRPTLEGEVSISGDAEFTIDVDSYSLDTDGEEVVTVTFAPTATITSTATITITSNDEGAPSTDVEVSGRGTAAPEG
ncbi:MAG TPA: choice-of-anchor D domain-containing protein, partial [Candidatus Latescibacteria bacterium]|nr:choice-of-anchor D domain-containing protein [Candidatus Latescibacterota bacterium]